MLNNEYMHSFKCLTISQKIFWKRSEAATSLGWLAPLLCPNPVHHRHHGPCYLSSLLNRYLPLPPFHFPGAGMVPILPTICGHSVAEMTRVF